MLVHIVNVFPNVELSIKRLSSLHFCSYNPIPNGLLSFTKHAQEETFLRNLIKIMMIDRLSRCDEF